MRGGGGGGGGTPINIQYFRYCCVQLFYCFSFNTFVAMAIAHEGLNKWQLTHYTFDCERLDTVH